MYHSECLHQKSCTTSSCSLSLPLRTPTQWICGFTKFEPPWTCNYPAQNSTLHVNQLPPTTEGLIRCETVDKSFISCLDITPEIFANNPVSTALSQADLAAVIELGNDRSTFSHSTCCYPPIPQLISTRLPLIHGKLPSRARKHVVQHLYKLLQPVSCENKMHSISYLTCGPLLRRPLAGGRDAELRRWQHRVAVDCPDEGLE